MAKLIKVKGEPIYTLEFTHTELCHLEAWLGQHTSNDRERLCAPTLYSTYAFIVDSLSGKREDD